MRRSKAHYSLHKASNIEKDVTKHTDEAGIIQNKVTTEVEAALEGRPPIRRAKKHTDVRVPCYLQKEPSKNVPKKVKRDLEIILENVVQTTKSIYPGTDTGAAVVTVDRAVNTTDGRDFLEIEMRRACTSQGVDLSACPGGGPRGAGAARLALGHKIRKISGGKDKLRLSASEPHHKEGWREITEDIIALHNHHLEQQKTLADAEDTNVTPKPKEIADKVNQTDEGANTSDEQQPGANVLAIPYQVWGYVRDCMIYPLLTMIRQEPEQAEQTEENIANLEGTGDIAKSEVELGMLSKRNSRKLFSFGNILRVVQDAGRIVNSIFSLQTSEDNNSDTDSNDEDRTRPSSISKYTFGSFAVWRASGAGAGGVRQSSESGAVSDTSFGGHSDTRKSKTKNEFPNMSGNSEATTQTEWIEVLNIDEYLNKLNVVETKARPIYVDKNPEVSDDPNKEIFSPEALDQNKKAKRKAKPSLEKSPGEDESKLRMIGMFSDGIRRTDLVLVMPTHLPAAHEELRMQFLTGLVKQGLQIETEMAVLEENKDYQFVKLHATDLCLNNYADRLGLKKYFRDNNEEVVYQNRKLFWNRLLRRQNEIRWLKRIRALQNNPLHLSTLDRSHIVHIIVQHLRFGKPENYFGIHRLIQRKVFVDVYALHESVPYRSDVGEEFSTRQMLCKKWYSWSNFLKDQPHHLIYEYFGPRVALYFVFYELYNKALLVASIWGVFMSLIYIIKDPQYLKSLRNFVCNNAKIRDPSFMLKLPNGTIADLHHRRRIRDRSVVCAECEGEGPGKVLCPYTVIHDYCFDLHFMSYFDSPYMIVHSIGIAILAQIMWRRWQQIMAYWHWAWEEREAEPQIRPQHEIHRHTNMARLISHKAVVFMRYIAFEILLPCFIFVIPILLILLSVVGTYQYVRPLSVKKPESKDNLVPVIADNKKWLGLLVAIAAAVQIVLFVLEKIFHNILTMITKVENHRTHANYERSLASKLFLVSLFYSSSLAIYYGWLKGTFYYSPLGQFDLNIEMRLFSNEKVSKYNMSKLLPQALFTLLRRALYLHCGPFSCFRQAVCAFFVIIMIRIVLVTVIGNLIRKRPRPMNTTEVRKGDEIIKHASRPVPTAELEKSLLPLTEERVTNDYSSLMLQVALVLLFTPMFPLAPLFALIVNYFDIRMKARSYLLHSRRALLHRRGLGAWTNMFGLIAHAVPFFHGLTICKTEVFKKYVFYKSFARPAFKGGTNSRDGYMSKNPNWKVDDMFVNFMLQANYYFDNVTKALPHFAEMNKYRVVDQLKLNKFKRGSNGTPCSYFIDSGKDLYNYGELTGCRMDGFFDLTMNLTSVKWPLRWDYMSEPHNRTYNVPSPDHYHLLYVKTLFYICYLIFNGFLFLILRSQMNILYLSVGRRLCRQQALRRHRLNELRFLASEQKIDANKRANTAELRMQK